MSGKLEFEFIYLYIINYSFIINEKKNILI